ncbi:endonuclease domain-containing protein [Nocardia sp. NPDC058058]|uniref:endonuclease domain-containing protein n=1 Tax=Nocardia sp. NPDC058058 TaxID=3346317 RepID=UPI0036D8A492
MGSTDGKPTRDRLAYYREYNGRRHGVDAAEYRRLLRRQRGKCAVCGTKKPGGRGSKFAIDHDHAHCPGRHGCPECIRALICHNCNMGLGQFKDRPELLEQAAEYVRAHRRNPDAG